MSSDQTTSRAPGEATKDAKGDYDITAEVFIGSMVSAIGLLVLITPLVSTMPQDHPMNATLIDVVIGLIYIAIGALVFYRARLKIRRR